MRIGKITENALKRSVLKLIRTEYKNVKSAAVGSDCAFSNDGKCFSAVCPVTCSISDGAFYAVSKAVNSLVAQGIKPDHFTASILLPADADEGQLKDIVRHAIEAGRFLEVPYSGGHTEVTTAVTRPVVTVHAAGYMPLQGKVNAVGYLPSQGAVSEKAADCDKDRGKECRPGAFGICNAAPHAGQALVVTKWIALEGTAILAGEKKAELATRYPVPFIEDAMGFKRLSSPASRDSEAGSEEKSLAVHDISSGGVFAALWELAERAGCGLEADLRAIPIRQETIEVCEFLGVNPYLLTSAGSLLIACDHEEELMERLAVRGINAAVIGHLREGNERILRNDDETRFLDMPQADELVKVFS